MMELILNSEVNGEGEFMWMTNEIDILVHMVSSILEINDFVFLLMELILCSFEKF